VLLGTWYQYRTRVDFLRSRCCCHNVGSSAHYLGCCRLLYGLQCCDITQRTQVTFATLALTNPKQLAPYCKQCQR
jgi:hypothetical protein